MTRGAVARAFEGAVGDLVAVAAAEFDVVAALESGLRGAPGTGVANRLVDRSDRLQARVVEPELDRYRRTVCEQFDVVLDVAAGEVGSVGAVREELLARDLVMDAVDQSASSERRRAIADRLCDRYARMAAAAAPLVASPHDDFWRAVAAELTPAEARECLETCVRFTDPIAAERDALSFRTTIDPEQVLGGGPMGLLAGGLPSLEVEFTDEALRVMRHGERVVLADLSERVEEEC